MARRYEKKEQKKGYTKRNYAEIKYSAPIRRIIIFILLYNGKKLTLNDLMNIFEIAFPDIIYDDLNLIEEATSLIQLSDYDLPCFQRVFDKEIGHKWYELIPIQNQTRGKLKRIEERRKEILNNEKNGRKSFCPFTQTDRTLLLLQLLLNGYELNKMNVIEIFETTVNTIDRDIKVIETAIAELSVFGYNYEFRYDGKNRRFILK